MVESLCPNELAELNWLDVSARLAWMMTYKGSDRVALEVGIPVTALLDMIEGSRGVNRRVLRYLKLRRINRYRFRPLQPGESG